MNKEAHSMTSEKATSREMIEQWPAKRVVLQGFPGCPDCETEAAFALVLEQGKDRWGDEDETRLGILLTFTHPVTGARYEFFNGNHSTCNVLFWVRALWFVEVLPFIEHFTFMHRLYRGVDRSEVFKEYRALLQAQVGSQLFEEFMMRPFELTVIQQWIALAERGIGIPHGLYDVSMEIKAGTIRWSQELKQVGVRHPDYWQALHMAKAQIVAQYQAYLTAYCTAQGYTRNYELEWNLTNCVERRIDCDYGTDVVCLLSSLQALLSEDEVQEGASKLYMRHHPDDKNYPRYVAPGIRQRLQELLFWFFQTFLHNPVSQQLIVRTPDEYQVLLLDLHARYQSLPVVCPLVPGADK